jgi:hypothetical protein
MQKPKSFRPWQSDQTTLLPSSPRLRRLLLRSLEKVDAEWLLIATTHNLIRLFRYRRSKHQWIRERRQAGNLNA